MMKPYLKGRNARDPCTCLKHANATHQLTPRNSVFVLIMAVFGEGGGLSIVAGAKMLRFLGLRASVSADCKRVRWHEPLALR